MYALAGGVMMGYNVPGNLQHYQTSSGFDEISRNFRSDFENNFKGREQ